jgi:hypothetical protein
MALAERVGVELPLLQTVDSEEHIKLSPTFSMLSHRPVANYRLQSRTLSYTDLTENSNE